MHERIAAGVAALALCLSSGITGELAHLCMMDRVTPSECCCESHHTGDPCARVQRPDDCCRMLLVTHDRVPVTAPSTEHLAPPLLAAAARTLHVPRAPSAQLPDPGAARDPPCRTGPPLFVHNCSYLI